MQPKYCYNLIIYLLIGISASAQQVVVTELPTQKQLPVAHIHRVFQDTEGYMWYATETGGLCRDNGYQIDVFRSDLNTPHLLSSNHITCITEDKAHQIWFGTQYGLYLLDKATYQIKEVDKNFKKKWISTIYAVRDGSIWVAAGTMIYHYSSDGKQLGSYQFTWKNNNQNVSDFFEDSQRRLWVLWYGGIMQYNPTKNEFVACEWTCDSSPAQMIEDTQNSCYWIATWGKGIVRYTPFAKKNAGTENYTLQPATMEGTEHKSLVLGLLKDSQKGYIWVTSMDDLYAYQIIDNKLQSVSTEHFLPKRKRILDRIVEDHSGNVWVPGYSPHTFILSFDPNEIKRFPTNAMTATTGYPVMVDRIAQENDYYWIWQGRTGLSLYHPDSEEISFSSDFPEGAGKYNITKCIENCRTQPGIWTASNSSQVLHFQHKGMNIELVKSIQIPDNEIARVLKDEGKGYLWIGTEKSIFQYSLSTGKLKRTHSNTGIINDMAIAVNGNIYCATEEQQFLCCTPDGKTHVIQQREPFSSISISPDDTVWTSTLEGNVYRYDCQQQALVRESNACNANGDAVKGISSDKLGHLWILADQYVKEYNPKNQSFRMLFNSDRFIQVDYFHCVYPVEDGKMCLGGIGAFCVLHPSVELNQTPENIKPVISSITIDGKSQIIGMDTQKIELLPNNINVEISFSTLEHLHAKQICYAYRLKGWDENWKYLSPGINTAYFTKLPKGNYTLEIKATDIHGCWAQPISCLQIHRLPAWYETWWAYTLYTLSIVLIGIGLMKTYFNRIRRKQQVQMDEQLTQMKFRFFTNISHEFRTPLTLIITPLDSILSSIQDSKLKDQLSSIYRNAQELLQLVNQLLDFRKLEMNGEKLHLMNGDIQEFVSSACEAFRPIADNKQIQFSIASSQQLYIYFDHNKVHRILYNILSNAFKFTPSSGIVKVFTEKVTKDGVPYICIHIQDTGKGIETSALTHIFNRYYQAETKSYELPTAGSGIGLHIVKEYALLHQGFIEVNSKLNEGTEFRIYLPTNLKKEQSIIKEEAKQKKAPLLEGRKSILIVEDNDEFRKFLQEQLSEDYQVWEASNGVEAEAIANEKEVDIVVSDIMMPGMDGFELCRRLKQNIKTSHLFVILLTARIGDESQLQGYQSGADFYLTKPFSISILRTRIQSLLELRKKLIHNLNSINWADKQNQAIESMNKMDNEFIGKLTELIEKDLTADNVDTGFFADNMNMSASTLYRKIKALTGLSTNEFIRKIKINNAERMLLEQKYTISEISFKVGINTVSYFRQCFQKEYGMSPSQYLKKVKGITIDDKE